MEDTETTTTTETLRSPDGKVVVWFEEIGPARADELVKTYKIDYRRLRPTYVEGLARDMAINPDTGETHWNFDGSPVRIDEEGNFFDRHHRMHAIKKSGTTHTFLMVAGLPKIAYHTTDTGLARNYGDLLRMRGYANVALRTALLKLISRWQRNVSLDDGKRLTHAELDDLHDTFVPEVNRAIQQCVSVRYKVHAPMSVVAFCWWLFTSLDVAKATEFMLAVAEGENLRSGMPAYTLRERLRNDLETKHSRMEYAHMFISAWNAFIRGDTEYRRIPIPTYLNRERMAKPLVPANDA